MQPQRSQQKQKKQCLCDTNFGPGNLPAIAEDMRDTGLIPGREDLSEKEIEIHSSILAWRIPWTEETGGLQSLESQSVRHD